jgi:chromosome segregation ATPase
MDFANFQKKQVEETIFKLRRTIEKQEWKIQEMQREIDRLCKQQQQNQQQQQQQQPSSPNDSPAETRSTKDESGLSLSTHTGQWVMDQDSKDFLEFPVELKENLRMEKRKRLEEVAQQMKFILDSDAIQDSNGSWDCCGQNRYESPCSKNRTKQ